MIDSILGRGAQVITQRGAVILLVEQAAILEDGHDAVDERIDSVLIDVRRDPEAVDSVCLEPLLHVVSGLGSWSHEDRVVIDDTVRKHVAAVQSSRAIFRAWAERGSPGDG